MSLASLHHVDGDAAGEQGRENEGVRKPRLHLRLHPHGLVIPREIPHSISSELPGPTMTMPKCRRLVMIEDSVASCPPCWVAVKVKAPLALPFGEPLIHKPPV
jgi:hypothetical protein